MHEMRQKAEPCVLKIITALLLLLVLNNQARAENCPDFYRFVDFGLKASDGTLYRGGPTYRAEGLDGQELLIQEQSTCLAISDRAIDGRGNPIPIVTSVYYKSEKVGINLQELRLTTTDNVEMETERNAVEHRAKLDQNFAIVTKGSNYLCANLQGSESISCQLVSPFGDNLALVVYCSSLECRMPVLPIEQNVIAVARWRLPNAAWTDQKALALDIVGQVEQIHTFLVPLSS